MILNVKAVDLGYHMGNAGKRESVKAVADYVTDTNEGKKA